MYDYIKGNVTRVTPEYLVVEQQGIGWQVFAPNPYSFGDGEIQVFTHHHVREDAALLFGFPTLEQRELFRKLISVSGIGPKGALAILASGQPQYVVEAIEAEDEKYLIKFPGVGKKTARQIILDLKGKLNDFFGELPMEAQTGDTLFSGDVVELEEAMLALAALGYSEREITKVKPKLKDLDLDTEGYMKRALQLLLKQS